MGAAPKAAFRQPELIAGRPAGLFERRRAQDQDFSLQTAARKCVALGGVKEGEPLYLVQECFHEAVQHRRVALHDVLACPVAGGDEDGVGPLLVAGTEPAVPPLLLNGVGQHPAHALEAILGDDAAGAVRFQVHTVEAGPDGRFNGLLAGDVALVARPPQPRLIAAPGLGQRAQVQISVVCQCQLVHLVYLLTSLVVLWP